MAQHPNRVPRHNWDTNRGLFDEAVHPLEGVNYFLAHEMWIGAVSTAENLAHIGAANLLYIVGAAVYAGVLCRNPITLVAVIGTF